MNFLATAVFAELSVIAALHAYWGLGGLWPGSDARSLIDAVVGNPRMTAMPSREITLVVAALIFTSGLFALGAVSQASGPLRFVVKAGVAVIALVFLARGVGGYLAPQLAGPTVAEPFATLNRLYYSPLCLAFAVAFCALFFAKGAPTLPEAGS